jgi:hypothetical protein
METALKPFVENPHSPVEVIFEMRGPVFDKGLPLPITIKALEAIQSIFDRTYTELAHKKKISSLDRGEFFLSSQGIYQGSLLTTLGVIFTSTQPGLPLVTNLGPAGVWEYTKETFKFLKLVYGQFKKGDGKFSVTQSGDGSIVNVNTGTQTVTFNNAVFNIANKALPAYESLTSLLAPNRVTEIRLGEREEPAIRLVLEDANLFNLPTTVGTAPQNVHGEIFEFDKFNRKGRISVAPLQELKHGNYRFEVVGQQDQLSYIEAMKDLDIVATYLEETVDHPLGGRRIVGLQILRVEQT